MERTNTTKWHGVPLDDDGLHVDRPNTIGTFTGRIDPLNPSPSEINIEDIAHALARICRYGGHCVGFMSVARHSIWVMERLEHLGSKMALTGLLHDAAEAYIGDVPRPLKRNPEMQVFLDAEKKLEACIAEVFDLAHPLPDIVMEADRQVLTEMELPDRRYTWFGDYQDDEKMFLWHYNRLTKELGDAA